MKIKEMLQEVREMRIPILNKEERILRLRARAEKITMALSGEKENEKQVNEIVEKIAIYAVELAQEVEKLLKKEQKVIGAIQALESKVQQEILMLYYIDGYTWEEVSEKMYYSRMQVYRLHQAALQKLEKNNGKR